MCHVKRWAGRVAISTAVFASSGSLGFAQVSGAWIGPQDATWGTASNWTSNPLIPSAGGTAHFDAIVGQLRGPWLVVKAPVDIGRLEFGDIVNTTRITSDPGMLKLVGPAEVFTSRTTVNGGGQLDTDEGPFLIGVGGTAGLMKRGPGLLALRDNVYTGDTIVREGGISLWNDAGLGAAGGGRLILDGGVVSGPPGVSDFSVSHPIVLEGTGGTFSPWNRFTLAGTVSGAGAFNVRTVSGINGVFLTAANTYTGSTNIAGNIVLRGGGSILGTSGISLTSGLISLDSRTSTLAVNRIGDNAPITIHTGTLELLGSPTISINEQVGTISVTRFAGIRAASVSSTIAAVLTAEALVRAPNSFVAFSLGSFSNNSQIRFNKAPALTGGGGALGTPTVSIMPYARANLVLCTYDPAVGVRALNDAEFESSIGAAAPDRNLRLDAPAPLSAPLAVNSLHLRSGTLSASSGGGTVSITSGAIQLNNTAIATPLQFGGVEAIISGTGTISGAIDGNAGVTLAGPVTLSGTSAYTGQTTVVGSAITVLGDVIPGTPGPLGADASTVRIRHLSALQFGPSPATPGVPATFGRSVFFEGAEGGGNSVLAATAIGSVFAGAMQVDAFLSLGNATASFTISGKISGTGRLNTQNTGADVTITGDNDFAGHVDLYPGMLRAGSDTAFGTATIGFGVGTLAAANGPRTLSNHMVMMTDANVGAGPALTLTGPLEVSEYGPVLTVASGADVTFAGPITGAPGLNVRGDGTLRITNATSSLSSIFKTGLGRLTFGQHLRLANVNVNQGTLHVEANGTSFGASRVGMLTLAGGTTPTASFDLDDKDLITTSGSYAMLAAQIRAARNFGAWDHAGLTSVAAAGAPNHTATLGLLPGTDYLAVQGPGATFNGFAVAASDLLVKYTYYGDTDLNGIVNFDDYARTDNGFNSQGSGGAVDWFHGDFDYNGVINFDDYALIDLAFNTQSGTLRRAMSFLDGSDRSDAGMNQPALQFVLTHFNQFGEGYASSLLNAVPEPAQMGMILGIGAALLQFRRRSRKNP
ncbi:hypothetical protein BH09PLA1_BH09PLA1_03320 [soil metagenome]